MLEKKYVVSDTANQVTGLKNERTNVSRNLKLPRASWVPPSASNALRPLLLATTNVLSFNHCQNKLDPHSLQQVKARILISHVLSVAWIWFIISQTGCGIFYFCIYRS